MEGLSHFCLVLTVLEMTEHIHGVLGKTFSFSIMDTLMFFTDLYCESLKVFSGISPAVFFPHFLKSHLHSERCIKCKTYKLNVKWLLYAVATSVSQFQPKRYWFSHGFSHWLRENESLDSEKTWYILQLGMLPLISITLYKKEKKCLEKSDYQKRLMLCLMGMFLTIMD